MSRFTLISTLTINANKDGHNGLFTNTSLAMLLGCDNDDTFRSFLGKACRNGTLKRVAKGIYINPLSPPNPRTVLYHVANLLRWSHFNYVSLESQLSHLGLISQIPINYLTIMTTGTKGRFDTDYGVIEFTHTKRSASALKNGVYYDEGISMFRALPERAEADLRRVGRNVGLLEESNAE